MKAKLKSVASVQMGHSFRTRLDPDQSGNVVVIQMKDLTEDNRLNQGELVVIDMKELKEKHRVEVNDIAFRSRGLTNTAALIDAELENAVVAAPLLRIRVEKKNKIDPAYLCWFINQPASQAALLSQSTGTVQRTIGKSALESLELVIPPIDVQIKIVELERLAINEQRIMKELAEKKRQLMEGILMRFASESQ